MTCRHHPCDIQTVVTATSTTAWCKECKSNVSLGPANDTPEVMIEIRAAEIVQIAEERNGLCGWDAPYVVRYDNVDGWLGNEGSYVTFLPADWQAGYLARAIATHDEDLK